MRILFLSSIYPTAACPSRGLYNGQLCRALGAQHDVRVIAPLSWRDPWNAAEQGGQDDSSILTMTPRFYYVPGVFRGQLANCMWHSIRPTVDRTLHEFQPDVVLSYWAYPDGAVAQRAARRTGIPCVNMVGGSDVLLDATQTRRGRMVSSTFRAADQLVAVSENIAAALRQLDLPDERIHVVPRGIDSSTFYAGDRHAARLSLDLPTGALIVFGCGRLVEVKDWPLFLDTCVMLREQVPEIQVAIAGDGPLRPRLEQRIERLGLGSCLRLLGDCRPSQLATWYRAADCTLLTSHSEGIPNVLLESISCGTPFVATNVGGIATIADPQRDCLVDFRNALELCDAIQKVVTRQPEVVRRWRPPTWERSAAHLADVCEFACQPSAAVARNQRQLRQIVTTDNSVPLNP